MSVALHWAALACYLTGTGIYLAFVLSQRRALHRVGATVLGAGFLLHTLALGTAWAERGVLPAATLRQSLDLLAWALMGVSLAVNLRVRVMILGAVTAPLCALLMLAAAVLPPAAAPPSPLVRSLWVAVHVIAIMLGYALLALNFLGGVLYLVQDRQIRGKKLGAAFRRLPPLNRLEALSHQALVAGFVLMTLGLVIGAAYAQATLGSYWRWDPKEVWALVTWLLYAALIHTRLVQGWRGRRGAWLGAVAFAVLVFTYLGVGLLVPGYHAFGTIDQIRGPLP